MPDLNISSTYMKEQHRKKAEQEFKELEEKLQKEHPDVEFPPTFEEAYSNQIKICKGDIFDRELALRKILQEGIDNLNKLSKVSYSHTLNIASVTNQMSEINVYSNKIAEVIGKQSLMNVDTIDRLARLDLKSSLHGYTLLMMILALFFFIYGVDWLALTPFLVLAIINYVCYRRALLKLSTNTDNLKKSIINTLRGGSADNGTNESKQSK